MKNFGYETLPEKLTGDGIHALDNVITLSRDMSIFFNMLIMWFEAIVSDLTSLYTILSVCRMARKTHITLKYQSQLFFVAAKPTQSY
jgi:hypothetical protein